MELYELMISPDDANYLLFLQFLANVSPEEMFDQMQKAREVLREVLRERATQGIIAVNSYVELRGLSEDDLYDITDEDFEEDEDLVRYTPPVFKDHEHLVPDKQRVKFEDRVYNIPKFEVTLFGLDDNCFYGSWLISIDEDFISYRVTHFEDEKLRKDMKKYDSIHKVTPVLLFKHELYIATRSDAALIKQRLLTHDEPIK